MKRHYKDWLKAYQEFTDHSEAPQRFHFWTGVSTIAGALRRKTWIDMGYFVWYPNFFIVFVAPPGVVSKSTTASIGMDLLGDIPGVHFGPTTGTWQGLIRKMEEYQEEFEAPDGNYYPMTAVTCIASELGSFLNPRDREQSDILTDLWDGKKSFDKLTKMDGSEEIIAPWINLIGCTTPSWIAENLSDYFHGGGLASRMVFVYSETKRKLVAYPFRHIPEGMEERRRKLVEDLERIATMCGPFELSEDAIKWGEKWYEKHHFEDHSHLQGERFRGYLARKQTHIHKLAMVLAAAQRDERVITQPDLERADKEITALEKDMPQVFGQMNQEKEMTIAADVLDYLRKNGKMRKRCTRLSIEARVSHSGRR